MATQTDNLKHAISQSIHEDRIVAVEYDGDISAALTDLEWDGDTDYARENDGSYDVWGWTDATPDSEQEWRLNIRCTE